ncbi:MAG TPA: hypothetical protein DD990_19300 [Cyanobacteria bacterium UBA11368]|nr:hypothetical protein [Cyanobacteria bacterium UBA11368]
MTIVDDAEGNISTFCLLSFVFPLQANMILLYYSQQSVIQQHIGCLKVYGETNFFCELYKLIGLIWKNISP